MPSITKTELKALLQAEKLDALGGMDDSELKKERQKALDYYMGDMSEDMPSAAGRSAVVSSDVADTVEGLMPALMEIFASGDEVVRFEPVGPEDEEAAEQETDYVNHVFMQQNPGFLVLYSMIKDALLSKVGIAKVWWETGEKEERETYVGLSDDVYGLIAADDGVEIIEHTEYPAPDYMPEPGPDGVMPEPPLLHDITVVCRKDYGKARIEPVPPEEFGIEKSARSIQAANYCFHQVERTEADLIAQGYDPDQVRDLPSDSDIDDTEELSRDTVEDQSHDGERLNKSARRIRVTEHYVRMEYEGDEKACLYRVTTGGDEGEILRRDGKDDIERVDMMPFAAMTPVPITHRFFGRSIADLVMEHQRIKTALYRGLLDNTYLANNPRIEVAEPGVSPSTIDDLLTSRPGGLIRTKLPNNLNVIQHPTIINHVLPVIELFDAANERRTGVTRQGQGIDANALQNQSATAVNQMFTVSQARMKLIARIFAETGIRDLFALVHAVIRKNDRQQNTVRLRNKWIPVDPRNWKTREDMTINVGLGSGGKAEMAMHLMTLMQIQEKAMANPGLGLVEPKHLYAALDKFVQFIGLGKSAQPYFNDPVQNPQQPQEPPPDPKLVEVQGKLELEKQKAGIQMQADQAKMTADIQASREKMQMEMTLQREQMAAEIQLKREQMQIEAALKREFNVMSAARDPIQMGGEVG